MRVNKARLAVAAAVVLALAASIYVAPIVAGAPSAQACAMPALAQKIAGKATAQERRPNGAIRFYLPQAKAANFFTIAVANAKSNNWPEAGKYWYFRTQTWVEWAQSDPCTGPDGYAFGFTVRCYNSPNSDGTNQTAVACNHYHHAALEYDHATHDFDPIWGHKFYNPQNQPSCTDTRYDLKLWIGSGDGSAAYLPG
jgi:hypothetical protein